MNIKNILTLMQVKGVGPAFFKKHRERLLCSDDIHAWVQEVNKDALQLLPEYEQQAAVILEDCKMLDVKVLSCLSDEYPKQLLEISDPPAVLYIKGNQKLLTNVIAIIGTRHSTPLGNAIAERLGMYFSKDFAICNGLVEGIDEHSICYKGEVTSKAIGIISGGMNYKKTCTKAHAKIVDEVLKSGGLILSEFPPQQPEDKYSGSKCSRIQAGLSHGLILVQSSLIGGSKYTLAPFAKLNRPLGVVHFPTSEEYQQEVFEANRTIVLEKTKGIAKMIGLKTDKKICIKDIIPIQGKEDYKEFEKSLSAIEFNNSLFI